MDSTEKHKCTVSAGKARRVAKKKNKSIFSFYYHFNRYNAHTVKMSSNILWLGEEMLLNIEITVIKL